MRNLLVFSLLAGMLAACATPVTQTPPPTPQVVEVRLTPAVRTWQPALRACAATIPELRLLLEEIPAARLDLDNGLSLRLGAPGEQTAYFATQIGEEQIVVIVHPDNPLPALTRDTLRLLFTGQAANWDLLEATFKQPVQVWSYPNSDELHQIFIAGLWGSSPPAILAYQAPDPGAMLEAVAANPGAVGYLPSSWLEEGLVQPVSVEDAVQDALRQPVLLLGAKEPQGLTRMLASCLQTAQK